MNGYQQVNENAPAPANMPQSTVILTIGTRRSKLALAQTDMVREALCEAHPGLQVAVEHITTKGDIILDRPLNEIGDKGLFVTEIEEAMRNEKIDLAVHSAKDLPSELPPDMALAAFPKRADPRDALLSRDNLSLSELPHGAVVGTSSLRRACQLRHLRPDLQIRDLRGNVDTRLRKLHEGQYDAIVLAAAGLIRLGLHDEITQFLEPDVMVPAVSQGVLGIEVRANDERTAAFLALLDDPVSRLMATTERAFLARIGGGCQVPIGAYARVEDETITLIGLIGANDGHVVRGEQMGSTEDPVALGSSLADQLLDNGGRALLMLNNT
ncbi:MAG: hydroxymethylbilane synthase [Chloroflexi bacterium AL-W]|nr:hydroxymethylbilane synthase [Chloroflexi bacterium AL-N1]NOK69202.1 hydroxymethylbilane synthase [Chloroflexi bacterium AL-N10]NOK77185.1 hydroxymethylbilane synthase [Chloroflexi bacterium AL-N5]NOK83830.1 hydroxymethylbilane synthase [Chloroflexi bacterium AL-W]NOK91040.1 hydroxymethylbilane synthase [Chloroflexi bacterium AL-N15]